MKTPLWAFLCALCTILAGCQTRIYDKNRNLRMVTYADITGFKYDGRTETLTADTINHSTPTGAAFTGTGNTLTAAGAAILTLQP